MELFWLIIASAGAGLGTGLAGLSAATVMVPILIVLCPSFQSVNGPYQATAIALASDILGSAVTAYTYAKHRHIDLKRGWVMMACILVMSTVGSYAAYKAGNVVLGNFTLFLTFFIGIRFLVKPESKNSGSSVSKPLDTKAIIISVFFGLTIGFGTGFVGTGGGMMMLVVFTMFLGMEHKTAVGTSTFIMTFTALIASVSHILIHPVIVTEKWPELILCIVITTVSSLLSARFANKVNNKTVSIVTGIVLTVLGAAMLGLNYREMLMSNKLIADTLITFSRYLVYIICFALGLIIIQGILRLPKDIFRKLLHVAAFTSSIFVVLKGEGWLAEVLTLLIFALIVYPLLVMAEKWDFFTKLLTEKQPGELPKSLLLLFVSQAILLAFSCGLLNKPYILITSTLAWGLGDIAAAWVGRPLGKHKIKLSIADNKKSWEGSAAMLVVAFVASVIALNIYSGYGFGKCLIVGLIVALVSSFTEMISKGGDDTFIVPLSNAVVLRLLSLIL